MSIRFPYIWQTGEIGLMPRDLPQAAAVGEEVFRFALRLHMSTERGRILGAFTNHLAARKANAAIEESKKYLSTHMNDWQTMVRIADMSLQINNVPQAVRYLRMAADQFWVDGMLPKAEALYRRISKLAPDQMAVRVRLAELHLRQGSVSNAQAEFLEAVQHYVEAGDFLEAISIYRRLIETDRSKLDWQWELAKLCEQEKMAGSAVAAYLEFAESAMSQQKTGTAISALDRAYSLAPKNPLVLWRLAEVSLDAGDSERAARMMKEFASVESRHTEVPIRMKRSLSDSKRMATMLGMAERLLQEHPDDLSLIIMKGDLYLKRGEAEKAFELFLQALDPRFAGAARERCLPLLEQLVAVQPSFYRAHEKLLILYKDLGQSAKAVDVMSLLVDAYISNEMYREAADLLNELTYKDPPRQRRHTSRLSVVNTLLMSKAERILVEEHQQESEAIEIELD